MIYKQTDLTNVEPDLRQESMATTAGKAYAKLLVTDEGKQLVQEAGFVPIY